MASALAGVDLMPAKLAELRSCWDLPSRSPGHRRTRGVRQLFAGLLRWRSAGATSFSWSPCRSDNRRRRCTGTLHGLPGWALVGLTYMFFLALGAVTANFFEETVWGGFVQGRLMARPGCSSARCSPPCRSSSFTCRSRSDQWLARHHLARRLDHLGVLLLAAPFQRYLIGTLLIDTGGAPLPQA